MAITGVLVESAGKWLDLLDTIKKFPIFFLLGRKGPNEIQSEERNKMQDDVGVDEDDVAISVDLTSILQMKEFFENLQIS